MKVTKNTNKGNARVSTKIVIAAICIVAGLAVSLFIAQPTIQTNTITLGSILILTGEGAAWGISSRNGIDLAIEDINNNGGINGKTLQVIHQDDQSDAKMALNAYRHLVDIENVDFIIGTTWSHTGIPLVEIADKEKVLMISPSLGLAEFNEGSDYLFNTWPHDAQLSEKLADHVYSKGHRNVALIGAEQLWVKDQTTAFKQRFENLGGSIEILVEPLPTDKNPITDALKIKEKSHKIDAIVSTTDGVVVGVLVAKKLKELGVSKPLYSITIDADIITAAEGSYEGMEFLTSLTPTSDFKKKYEDKTGIAIDIGGASAYDAVMLIAKAMKETQSADPTRLQEYLNSVKEYQGVSGHLVADGKGGFTKKFKIMKVLDGTAINL